MNAAIKKGNGGQRDRVSLWTGWKSRRKGTTEQEEMLAIGARAWDRMVTSSERDKCCRNLCQAERVKR